MYTCAGANSVPVCVSPQDREASKSNAVCWPFIAPCCGFIPSDAPSPLRTPEDSQTYEHISRSILPVSARPVSVCQLPTFSDVTPVQARKGGRQMEKTHNTEGLGSENISMFFSNSIANKKGFLPRPARVRGWTGAGSAGGYNAPGLPEIEGTWSGWNIMSIAGGENAGAFQSHWEAAGSIASATKEAGVWDRLLIKASRSNPLYGSSTTVMPASVNLPVILYLGISA